jgi:hypothetical protein
VFSLENGKTKFTRTLSIPEVYYSIRPTATHICLLVLVKLSHDLGRLLIIGHLIHEKLLILCQGP